MELSTGGSVLNMLEKPEFAFGFSEDEFLVFLRDMSEWPVLDIEMSTDSDDEGYRLWSSWNSFN